MVGSSSTMPTPDEARQRLEQEQNQHLRWLLGDLLVARSYQTDWYLCKVLQQLAAGSNAGETAWNGLIERFRRSLLDESEAGARAHEILRPGRRDFDEKLDDLIAEMIAVVFLSGQQSTAWPSLSAG